MNIHEYKNAINSISYQNPYINNIFAYSLKYKYDRTHNHFVHRLSNK